MSLRETLEKDFPEVSNTALILVVVLDSLGFVEIFRRHRFCML